MTAAAQTEGATWVVDLEEDPLTGDMFMPIPEELLREIGWEIGDTLVWGVNEATGEITLTKKPTNE
jgi:hypothetical protein